MSDKRTATQVKARLPKGMRDVEARELRALKQMLGTISDVYELYGFEPLDTPAFEYTDALGKFLPDTDRPNEGVFSFQDEDEQWVSLRYDLTAPLARYVAANFDALPKPFRRYQSGYVYRNEKPGPGRFRQFMQFDADTVGTANPAADAEMCMLAADTLKALELADIYSIKLSNRKILDGLLEVIGLGGIESTTKRLTVLRAIDKFDRLGESGVRLLLGRERKDESGAVTPGADLRQDQIDDIINFITMGLLESPPASETANSEWYSAQPIRLGFTNFEEEPEIVGISRIASALKDNETFRQGWTELANILHLTAAAGYREQVQFDQTIIRGLEYYTGSVMEVVQGLGPFLSERTEDGRLVRFGSIGGGGRYDGLVSRFRSQPVPATGFSIGVSRLYAVLSHLGKLKEDVKGLAPVVVLVMDKARTGEYLAMARELRAAGIRAEMYLGDAGMKAQMKYADKRGAPCVIIQGEDERARGEVTIKDLFEGARLSGEIADHSAWREGRPAQFAVPASDMVREVRLLLERQKRP
jgi:histidyl-tRNA synthetase